ncbi:unnamed protein product [Owenia fusiformis]|uniref:Uncharacterized protein n=1 Tax=Owenia fusiformis TaxID=6347 RepID=A0A8J1U3N1_OWEFU|nr:unnamed protein product [Owenia fusiformis]
MSSQFLEEIKNGSQPKGLYQTKRSNGIPLQDPNVVRHLNTIYMRAADGRISSITSEFHDVTRRRESRGPPIGATLEETIDAYNKKMQMSAFKVKLISKNPAKYEGVLRFFLENGHHRLTKAVRLQNDTCVRDLLTLLLSKVDVENKHDVGRWGKSLYQVVGRDEVKLDQDDKPLDIAVNARTTPHFILRMQNTGAPSGQTPILKISSKSRSKSAERPTRGRLMEEKQNTSYECALKDPHDNSDYGFLKDSEVAPSRRNPVQSSFSSRNSRLSVRSVHEQHVPQNITQKGPGQEPRGTLNNPRLAKLESEPIQTTMSNRSPSAQVIKSLKKKRQKTPRTKDNGFSKSFSLRESKARSKSMGNLNNLDRMSLRKKRKGKENDELDSPNRTELSVEETLPGILKIFGESIAPGANYKSVLASSRSTSQELVKEALERYGISKSKAKHYVLCDVIGKFGEGDNPVWETQYERTIGDTEKPLILQSFWKPGEGYSRRFEVRVKSELLNNEVDTVTSGLNANARRMLISQTRSDAIPNFDRYATRSPSPIDSDQVHTMEESTSSKYYAMSSGKAQVLEMYDFHDGVQSLPSCSTSSDGAPSIVTLSSSFAIRPPTECPYFLTLQGNDTNNDNIMYILADSVALIGRQGDAEAMPDIGLNDLDILPKHCWVCKKPIPQQEINENSYYCIVTLDPFQGAYVAVNGIQITSITELKQGDMVHIGEKYVFMFKDPTLPSSTASTATWVSAKGIQHVDDVIDVASDEISIPVQMEHATPGSRKDEDSTNAEVHEWRRHRRDEYNADHNKLKLSYRQEREDELLENIITSYDAVNTKFKLLPAYLLPLCVEFSSIRFAQESTRELLLKIASLVQSVVWDKTSLLSSKHPEKPLRDSKTAMEGIIPELKYMASWMANSIELLHFFRGQLPTVLLDASKALPRGARMTLVNADSELLAVLEEAFMYTFQQTVYHLTKTMYASLPSVLDSNPFNEDELESKDPSSTKPRVSELIYIYQTTLDITNVAQLHKNVVSQLFSYLFFFTNTAVFNSLMTKGSGIRYYKWSKGALIRGNLDKLESWAADNNLQLEFQQHFKSFSTLCDLLATPKVHLTQAEWTNLRRDFSELSPSQLQQVLSEYQLGPGKQRPRSWCPQPEELEDALNNDGVMLTYNNHPPLCIPGHGYMVDHTWIEDSAFHEALQTINSTFDEADDDHDSGMCAVDMNNEVFEEPAITRQPLGRQDKHLFHQYKYSSTESLSSDRQHGPISKTPFTRESFIGRDGRILGRRSLREDSKRDHDTRNNAKVYENFPKSRRSNKKHSEDLVEKWSNVTSELSFQKPKHHVRFSDDVTTDSSSSTVDFGDYHRHNTGTKKNHRDSPNAFSSTRDDYQYNKLSNNNNNDSYMNFQTRNNGSKTVSTLGSLVTEQLSISERHKEILENDMISAPDVSVKVSSSNAHLPESTQIQKDGGDYIKLLKERQNDSKVLASDSDYLCSKQTPDSKPVQKQKPKVLPKPKISPKPEIPVKLKRLSWSDGYQASSGGESRGSTPAHYEKVDHWGNKSDPKRRVKISPCSDSDYAYIRSDSQGSTTANNTSRDSNETSTCSDPYSIPKTIPDYLEILPESGCRHTARDYVLERIKSDDNIPRNTRILSDSAADNIENKTIADSTETIEIKLPSQNEKFATIRRTTGNLLRTFSDTGTSQGLDSFKIDNENNIFENKNLKEATLNKTAKEQYVDIISSKEYCGSRGLHVLPIGDTKQSSQQGGKHVSHGDDNSDMEVYHVKIDEVDSSSAYPTASETDGETQGVTEEDMDMLLHKDTMTQAHVRATQNAENMGFDVTDDVLIIDLTRNEAGCGLGLIDGLYTPLRAAGIYVRAIVKGGPADKDKRLSIGDRILAVNGTSIVGADYSSATNVIRKAGERLRFLVAKSSKAVAESITASQYMC